MDNKDFTCFIIIKMDKQADTKTFTVDFGFIPFSYQENKIPVTTIRLALFVLV